ncbi:DUF6074 family protein [Brucellaceae bacterium C25G]
MSEQIMNTALIIAFPVEREVRHIRETARQVERRMGEKANKYFRTECNRLCARLQVHGFDRETIEEQIERFADAVQTELNRMYSDGCRNNGNGGAA